MNETQEEYLKKHAEHAQRLDDLAGELQTLDLSEISHKVGDLRCLIRRTAILLETLPSVSDLPEVQRPENVSFCVVSTGLWQSTTGSGLVLVLSLWRSWLHGL